jgi:undecaprenyl-diphosphatase
MTLLEAVILGVVQGITEFLPISSSAHLVLARSILGIETPDHVAFEIAVHAGTFLSVICVMGRVALDPLRALPALAAPRRWRAAWRADPRFRTLVLLALATAPLIVVGLVFHNAIDNKLGHPDSAAGMLFVMAAVLFSTRWARSKPGDAPISVAQAAIMGVAQSLATLPGISRSGSTISAGLHAGTERGTAGSFSFLMSIPAILGAVILESRGIARSTIGWPVLGAGIIVSFVTGVIAFRFLLSMLRGGRMWYFSLYLVLVGGAYFAFAPRR